MAQGKLKVKTKVPAGKKSNKSNQKAAANVKKVKYSAKKQAGRQIKKFKKEIQKSICNKIESELSQRAHHVEEGRAFKCIATPSSSAKNKKK